MKLDGREAANGNSTMRQDMGDIEWSGPSAVAFRPSRERTAEDEDMRPPLPGAWSGQLATQPRQKEGLVRLVRTSEIVLARSSPVQAQSFTPRGSSLARRHLQQKFVQAKQEERRPMTVSVKLADPPASAGRAGLPEPPSREAARSLLSPGDPDRQRRSSLPARTSDPSASGRGRRGH